MSPERRGRIVYSTGPGPACPRCGWPSDRCACAAKRAGAPEEPVPRTITAKLRIEKKGRGGKTVTVIDGLPRNSSFLEDLARELKRACGAGGTVGDGAIELQGDRRDRLRDLLARKGWGVKL